MAKQISQSFALLDISTPCGREEAEDGGGGEEPLDQGAGRPCAAQGEGEMNTK